jgi:hypothetical protein
VAPGPIWMGTENIPQVGFNPQIIQAIARCYTDCCPSPQVYVDILCGLVDVNMSVEHAVSIFTAERFLGMKVVDPNAVCVVSCAHC